MHSLRWPGILGVLVALAGCAIAGPTGLGGADTRFNGFCRCADTADLLAYQQRVRGLSGDELAAEYASASQALARQKTDVNRLRLALLLSLPGAAFRDDGRAASLADEVASRKGGNEGGLRSLAALVAASAAERRQQEERSQKLAQKLQEEEKRADALQQKLDGLKAIEKNLLNREPAKPVNVK
jgi:hypothetical protein